MTKEQKSPVKDKNYDLIRTLQMSLEHVYRMETYIADAEQRGDSELADWFRKIQDNNRRAGDQGKQMLMARMQQEQR
ncbi:hypothetical protein [Micromonospora globbae]|jgi:hypothetical protein|uniref:Uncharacterized protein n=1 Tax=Micromonospora globbae TaxID=1894969 RepID=A0A420F7S1_9ACTN|nr:hypothetical protein [Micromonospora globbae]RKF28983.1 hypothetical protein D7I43_02815 [Micromonospora globbae]WTF89135.1 hypothetical protein OH732_19775 [Micromonospora globbae]